MQTNHVGYNHHDIIVDGKVIGRVYPCGDQWEARAEADGVTVMVHRRTKEEAAYVVADTLRRTYP